MHVGQIVVLSGEDQDASFLLKNLSVFEAGRSAGNHILLRDPSVAMSHFRVCKAGEGYQIYDLGSKNGTLVNGEAIEKIDLRPGDRIQAGEVELQFDLVEQNVDGKIASCAPQFDDVDSYSDAKDQGRPRNVISHGTIPFLRVIEGEEKGKSFRLIGKAQFTVGRSTKADVRLRDGKVSRIHCTIEKVGDHFVVVDNNSANGTIVNGEPVKKTVLSDGDYVRLGFSILKYGWS